MKIQILFENLFSRSAVRPLLYSFLYLLYAYFCVRMLQISLQYIQFDHDAAFLNIKHDSIGYFYYLPVFFIHAFTSLLILPAGFTQFSETFRLKSPKLHRFFGRIYVYSVLFLAGPTGLILAVHANGGFGSQLGFCILGILWIFFTLIAVRKIHKGDFTSHRRYMLRSFALAMSAITLRSWKVILVFLFHPRPMDTYRLIAWLGWVVNLAAIEVYLYIQSRRKPQ